jgi:probable HAF family extracellular repeat protein
MIPRTGFTWMLALAIGALAASGAAAQTYTVTDLGSLGTSDTFAFAVSDSTRIAGFSWVGTDRHAFLWQKGAIQDLGLLAGGTYSWGNDINEAGQVCGFADDASGAMHVTLYRNGVLEDLGVPQAGGEARGVNNLTEIGGYLVTAGGFNVHALFWSAAAGFVDLTAATGASNGALAEDLNDHTQVVGWAHSATACSGLIFPHGTLWENPGTGWTATDLGVLGSYCSSGAYDINELGQVVGESYNFSSGAPVLWKKAASGAWQIQNLGSLGGSFGRAYAINNRSQIVGESQVAGGIFHAFLWQCNAIVDLNSRILPGSGWVLAAATGINDLGEIVGYGRLNGGSYRGVLLKPSPVKCCTGVVSTEPL